MTGPEHYREAERLLAGTDAPADPELGDPARYYPPTAEDLAAAQVHATLALAAAAAVNDPATDREWLRVIDPDTLATGRA